MNNTKILRECLTVHQISLSVAEIINLTCLVYTTFLGVKSSKWAVYGQLYNMGLIMRKPAFVGYEHRRLRPACASIGLINALKSI